MGKTDLSTAAMREPSEPPATSAAREKILRTAHDLFYRDGVRATGVDTLIQASGVAKATFYRHFPSKDDLVLAFLDYRHRRWMGWFAESLARHRAGQTEAERKAAPLAPLSAALAEWFRDPAFRGCAFINSVAEVGAAPPGVREIAARHKMEMTAVIKELLGAAPGAAEVAQAVALVVDGAIVRAQTKAAEIDSALAALDLACRALIGNAEAPIQAPTLATFRHSAKE